MLSCYCGFTFFTVEEGVRKRKGNLTKSAEHDRVTNVITLDIEPVKQIKTDFSSDGGFQKVVQMVNDHTIMFTGGADGYLRAWQVGYDYFY